MGKFDFFVNLVSKINIMEYTELDHLRDKEPVVTEMYGKLVNELKKFGPLKIEPKKTSIHLGNRFGFAGFIQGEVI